MCSPVYLCGVIQRKICMLGAFAVGKTSLVQQFVHSIFTDRYHTTVGVKVDRKDVAVDGRDVRLLLWDLAGEDDFNQVPASYLRGSAGLLYVIDGTRRETADAVDRLQELAQTAVGDVPSVVAINKVDLRDEWELNDDIGTSLRDRGFYVFETSAKTGLGVEEAFHWLAHRLSPE